MHSGTVQGSRETSLQADFEAAALTTGARVVLVPLDELSEYLASFGTSPDDYGPGYSTDLRRLLDLDVHPQPGSLPLTWISRARLGIASTGTVLVAESLAEDRIHALLCTRHILLLPSSCIVATHADAVATVRSCLTLGVRYVTLISGPSRTSDIEKVLTLGAHGPAELDVTLVDGWDPDDD